VIGLREHDQGISHIPKQHCSTTKVIPHVHLCCCDNDATIVESMLIEEFCKGAVVVNMDDEDLKLSMVQKSPDQ
jgi:hypothetical protein